MRVCVCARVRACVNVCARVHACMHVCMCECVCVCVFYFLFFANTSDGSSSLTSTIQGLYLDHVANASLLSMWGPYF